MSKNCKSPLIYFNISCIIKKDLYGLKLAFWGVKMDIDNLTLTDVIDITALRSLQDSFAAATGMAVAALEKNENVPGDSKWSCRREFCESCVKRSSEGADRCKKHIQKCVNEAKSSARPYVGICYAGISEFAVPVIVRGSYVGALVGGQVFTDRPDERKMSAAARNLGIEPDKYIAAANNIETMPEQRVEAAANLLSQMVTEMAESGYMRVVAAERAAPARDSFTGGTNDADSELKRKINSTVDLVDGVKRGCELIKNAVVASTKEVDNTDSIVKTIENASTQLTLIGFNASIEAKRAGAAGSGCNVIAQEVRTLAERNTKQVGEIENTLNGIKKSMGDINNRVRSLYGDIEKISDSMNELSYATIEAEQSAAQE